MTAPTPARLARVAVPRPFLGSLAYSLDPALARKIRPGMRVRVPLGRRQTIGIVDWCGDRAGDPEPGGAPSRLRRVAEVLDDTPVVGPEILSLCRWIADYYVAPLGVVLRAALPPGLLGDPDTGTSAPVPRTERQIALVAELATLTVRDEAFGRARRQREAYELLEEMGGAASVSHMSGTLGFSGSVLKGLVDRGLAEFRDVEVTRDPFAHLDGAAAPRFEPTGAQRAAIEALTARTAEPDPGVALLWGVTGSGKTLVYLELLERVLADGRSGILLVPEIALTPQTVERFRARFGDTVAVLHSALSAGERYDAWRELAGGERRIAIGARSAIFAPVRDLGVVILDEEHEGSYKQSDTPRYHARSVAVVRARAAGALCVLGSATPSLESWHNAQTGRYRLLTLPERVTGRPLPEVRLIDLRRIEPEEPRPEDVREGERSRAPGVPVFSPELTAALTGRLDRGEQTILLLNRRGFSTFVQCESCGEVWACPSCSVSLTHHRRRGRLVCHHCAYERSVPDLCDACGAPRPSFAGVGTEQVEHRLAELFPRARIERMDLDTTGTKWSHFEILERVRTGQVDILLGTQMIAKGLDFPNVTLVGVVNADVGLNLPDFRATERTFQLLEQVAGRAGRGQTAGEVLVQTSRPAHYALEAAASHDYRGFAAAELAFRAEPGYPPHRRLANVVVSGRAEAAVADLAQELVDWLNGLIESRRLRGLEIIGPAPCPIDRLRDRWRWHFLIKSDRPGPLGAVLRFLAEHKGRTDRTLRVEIDRDPEALL